jgi:hypothetical protein
VHATSKALFDTFQLGPRGDLAFGTVLGNVRGDRTSDIELVGVGIGLLRLLEFENLTGTKFKVLLLSRSASDRFI